MALFRKYSDYVILLLVILILILLLILYTDVHLAIIGREVKETLITGAKHLRL